MTKKKWMLTLEGYNHEWLKATIKQVSGDGVKVSGSTIINKLIERESRAKGSNFKDELVQLRTQMQLRKINEAEMLLAAKKAELTKKTKVEKDAVNV